MQAVYRIFQMIFGIIVSFAILYFLITYTGNYGKIQRELQRGEILKAFADEARSVYITGIPTNFTYFSKYDFSSCFLNAPEKGIPEIECQGTGAPKVPVDAPLLFLPGDKVYIGRDSLDYGWWTFSFAEAVPSTLFVFNPIDSTDDSWDIMKAVVEYLPDTSDEWSVVNVTFAFCDGPEIRYACGGRPCSKTDFLSILNSGYEGYSFSKCTANLAKGMRLVTTSVHCSEFFAESGACVSPPNSKGVGNTYLAGSGKAYVWKDPVDLVALVMGGSEKDEFGITMGEKIYKYKNSVQMRRMSLAAKVISMMSKLIAGKVSEESGCGPIYAGLSNALEKIPGKDYESILDMQNLNDGLNEAREVWQELAGRGCERVEYGI